MTICILDYGSGNVASVANMLSLFTEIVISNEKSDIENSSHLVLPGVGSFGASMDKIKAKIPILELREQIFVNKKPFLGICVGMQVMFQKGFEPNEEIGLGFLHGSVSKVESSETLPHVGWNNLTDLTNNPILFDLTENSDFYFVHSNCAKDVKINEVIARTEYGEKFPSIIQVENTNAYGVQFHPEKSQHSGKKLFSNFLSL